MNGRAQGDWWWVETYEECLVAIDQLEAKGSTFDTSALFTYEGDEFDVKYCFVLDGRFFLKYGRDNPFKYKSEDIKIYTFLFHKDTTIDDIAYSGIHLHCSYYFHLTPEYIENGRYREIDAADLEVAFANNLPYHPDYVEYFIKGWEFIDKETGDFFAYTNSTVPYDLPEPEIIYLPQLPKDPWDQVLRPNYIEENEDT